MRGGRVESRWSPDLVGLARESECSVVIVTAIGGDLVHSWTTVLQLIQHFPFGGGGRDFNKTVVISAFYYTFFSLPS